MALTGGTGTGATATVTVAPGTQIASLGTITGGSLYTTGVYSGVSLTGGTGTGATANITVAGGKVTAVTLVNAGSGYKIGNPLRFRVRPSAAQALGFTIPVAALGGPVTTVTLATPGFGYTVGDSLTAAASVLGGTGSGFSILVATVGGATTDGFVLKISLPKSRPPGTASRVARLVRPASTARSLRLMRFSPPPADVAW